MSHTSDEDSLAAGEERILVLHPHWKPLLWPVAAVAIVAEALIPSGRGTITEHLAVAVVATPLLMWWLIYLLLKRCVTTYELTTQRMRIHSGIIARTCRDIPLPLITSVSSRKGLLDRLLGCGTLVVESGDEHGEVVLPEVPHIERVQSTLSGIAENERLRVRRDG